MPKRPKVVGVLGGMGPSATIDFMGKVIALTPAQRDQDHIRLLVDHNPSVPDRQAAIVRGELSPGATLAKMALNLESIGADFLVMPCNSAHSFTMDILEVIRIPFVSIIDETIGAINKLDSAIRNVGLLATVGCYSTGIYEAPLVKAGKNVINPCEQDQELLMKLIYEIKAGKHKKDVGSQLAELASKLVSRGADTIVAGCTEIPLALNREMLDVEFVSSTDVLAERTVYYALGDIELPTN